MLGLGIALAWALACNAVLGIDNYRACETIECVEAGPDVIVVQRPSCEASTDCVAADAGVVCSQGACATISKLARGMSNHECVVLSDGTARCWGSNGHAQLGSGNITTTAIATPQVVLDAPPPDGGVSPPMTGIVDISLGYDFTCALRNIPTLSPVWCWGTGHGGTGFVGQVTTPIPVSVGNVSAQRLSAGSASACVLVVQGGTDQSVVCWGDNTTGTMTCDSNQCADGGLPSPLSASPSNPRKLASAMPPYDIATGLYALCIEVAQGHADCYGTDVWGNLGDNLTSSGCCEESKGAEISLPAAITRLEPADFYTCGKDNNGTWSCWGGNYGEGCPLLNGCGDLHAPTTVYFGVPILDLSPGWRHMCGTTGDNSVYCWGQNDHAQAGLGSKSSFASPAKAKLPASALPVQTLAAHRHWSCAVGNDRQVYCWGQNGDPGTDPTPWLLGAGSPAGDVLTPAQVMWE